MDRSDMPSASTSPSQPVRLTLEASAERLVDCAVEALVLAWLVQLMGGIVIGIASGLLGEMIPSLPPGLTGSPELEQQTRANGGVAFFHRHGFAILFWIMFSGKAAGQFLRFSRNPRHRDAAAWTKRVYRRISAQWFDLVVSNAFTAFIGVLVIEVAQQLSLSQWVWHFVLDLFRPLLQTAGRMVPSNHFFDVLGAWVSWYNANQFKFTFWLLYSAAICDDLGLPNYKTLGRWIWGRWFKRKSPSLPAPASSDAPGSEAKQPDSIADSQKPPS